jgi:hypothetical protein
MDGMRRNRQSPSGPLLLVCSVAPDVQGGRLRAGTDWFRHQASKRHNPASRKDENSYPSKLLHRTENAKPDPRFAEVLAFLQNARFQAEVSKLPGYDASTMGSVMGLRDAFPNIAG